MELKCIIVCRLFWLELLVLMWLGIIFIGTTNSLAHLRWYNNNLTFDCAAVPHFPHFYYKQPEAPDLCVYLGFPPPASAGLHPNLQNNKQMNEGRRSGRITSHLQWFETAPYAKGHWIIIQSPDISPVRQKACITQMSKCLKAKSSF